MRRAFEVELDRYQHNGQEYRARTGEIKLPSDLCRYVELAGAADEVTIAAG